MEVGFIVGAVVICGLALLLFSNFGKDPTKKTTSQLEREHALHDQVISTTDTTSSAYQRRSEARDRVEKELQRRGAGQEPPVPSEPAALPPGEIRRTVAAGYEEGWLKSKSEGKDDEKALETALVSGLLNRLVGIDGWSAIAPEMVQAMMMETMPFKFAGSRDACRSALIEYAVWREHPVEADTAIVGRAVSSMAHQMEDSGSIELLESLRSIMPWAAFLRD